MNVIKLFDLVFPPFIESNGRKPREILFGAAQRPPVPTIIIVAAQHALIILSRLMNSRRQFMIGLSLTVGMSLLSIPELASGVKESMRPVLGSGMTMGVLTAVVLNQIFKIGVSQVASIQLEGYNASLAATRFLEEKGADWGARRDVINRAGIAIGEALEVLQAENMLQEGSVRLKAKFDEMKLVLFLFYTGTPFLLHSEQEPDLKGFLDSDDDTALDRAVAGMSGAMIHHLADKPPWPERPQPTMKI
jgi:hypothetical protein